MTHALNITQPQPALLRNNNGIATPVNNNCCAAASVIAFSCSSAEGLIPHEKLREAATPNATLIAQNRPPAQPAVGYTHLECKLESPPRKAVDIVQIDERTEYEKEFPVPEGLQYCAQRETYITAAGAKTSDSFAREHYAYRAAFAAWKRRAWKHAALVAQQEGASPCSR